MFNERIKQLRLAMNLTQTQLAKKLGVAKQTVSNWENDNIPPSVNTLKVISKFFGVSTDYLLGLDDKKYLEVTDLTEEELAVIKLLIDMIKKANQ